MLGKRCSLRHGIITGRGLHQDQGFQEVMGQHRQGPCVHVRVISGQHHRGGLTGVLRVDHTQPVGGCAQGGTGTVQHRFERGACSLCGARVLLPADTQRFMDLMQGELGVAVIIGGRAENGPQGLVPPDQTQPCSTEFLAGRRPGKFERHGHPGSGTIPGAHMHALVKGDRQ